MEGRPSAAWYLLPIFFGLVGGVIMWFCLKDDAKQMAKKGFWVGIILTVVALLPYFVLSSIIGASLFI